MNRMSEFYVLRGDGIWLSYHCLVKTCLYRHTSFPCKMQYALWPQSGAVNMKLYRLSMATVFMLPEVKLIIDHAFNSSSLIGGLRPHHWSCKIQDNLSSWSEPFGPFSFNCEKCARYSQLLHHSPRHGGHYFQGMQNRYLLSIVIYNDSLKSSLNAGNCVIIPVMLLGSGTVH